MASHNESQNKRFNEASALVLAASDLLQVASNAAGGQLAGELDNNTLQNLAAAIYREAQVAELLYIQLHEMLEQTRNEQITLHASHPQVAMPLTKLNLAQLNDLLAAGETKFEALKAQVVDQSDTTHQRTMEQLQRTLNDVQAEISKRN